MRRLGRVPLLVWCITALYFFALLGYSILLPTYRAPDEPQHVDLARLFAEEQRYPAWDDRDLAPEVDRSTIKAEFNTRAAGLTADQAVPRAQRPSFDDLTGSRPTSLNQISQHPPLYYLVAGTAGSALTAVVDDPSFDLEVWFYRLVSVVMVTPLPLVIWCIGRRLRLPDPVAVAATLVPLAVPQFLHIGSSVNNDNLVLLTFWISTALVVRLARGDLHDRTALLAGVVAGAGLLTKAFALLLPLYALGGIGLAVVRGGPSVRRPALRAAAVYGGSAFVVGGWWWLRNLLLYGEINPSRFYDMVPVRDDVSVDLAGFLSHWAGDTTTRFWGSFGWFDVDLPGSTVALATFVTVAVLLAGTLLRRDRVSGVPLGDRILLASPLLLLVTAQFGFAFWNYVRTGVYPGMQGRYWFGALAGVAVAAVLGLVNLVRRRPQAAPLMVLAGAAVMNGVAVVRLLRFFWGAPGSGITTRIDAMLAWSPLPPGVVIAGAMVGGLVALATTGQLALLAVRTTDALTPPVPTGNTVRDLGASPVTPVAAVPPEPPPSPRDAVEEHTT